MVYINFENFFNACDATSSNKLIFSNAGRTIYYRQQVDCHYILCSYCNIASSHPSTFPSDPFFIILPSTTPKTVETANVTNPLAIKLLLNDN